MKSAECLSWMSVMVDQETIELQIPKSTSYVSLVRNTVGAIARQMRFEAEDVDDVKLAVGEACANAVRHGCPTPEPCAVRVLCHISRLGIEIEIRNHVDGESEEPAICTKPDTSREGGMGLYIMRKLMDEVDLEWCDGCATVRMVKRLRRELE